MEPVDKHGAQFATGGALGPDAVAASMQRGDGGFGREQASYYDHPVLQKAHWNWEIAAYFFIGGASAASSALAGLAAFGNDPADAALVRNGRYTALAGSMVSGVLLVMDLGRPERFLNMLRIVKLRSPMSVGVYALSLFSANAGVGAWQQLGADRIVPFAPPKWIAACVHVLVGVPSTLLMMTYTGVLISATAIPVWFTARRHIPAIFVCASVSAAAALQNALLAVTGGTPDTARKLEVIELVASLGEAALLIHWKLTVGESAKPLFAGARGRKLARYTLGTGIVLPALLTASALRSRATTMHPMRAILSAAATLVGGFLLRESIVYAGRDSADDPRAYLRHPE